MNRLLVTPLAILGLVFTPVGYGQAPSPAAVSQVMTNALAERNLLPDAIGSLWRFEGPTDMQNGSHTSGRVNELAINPVNPLIMYATGATGGGLKTNDGGATWFSLSKSWPIQAATAVAIDPNNPNRIFVGTGDYKRLDLVPPFSVGIMRS